MALYGGVKLVGRPDLENVRRLDLLPMRAIAEMQQRGMAVDRDWFRDLSTRLGTEMSELRREICEFIPVDKLDEFMARSGMNGDGSDDENNEHAADAWLPMNVDSPAQLSMLLFDVLGIGRGQQLKRTKSGDRISTGKKELEKLKKHAVVRKVLEYRQRVKLKTTYADKLPVLARWHEEDQTWRIHTQILTTRTTTGRLASKAPNLQNIPARSALGREIRKGFVASPGMALISVDFSQFEMRLGAHYSLDENLLRIFRLGLDPHTDTAMRAFNKKKEEVEVGEGKMLYRDPCKNVNFGVFYGLSETGLYDLMALTYATAGKDLPDEIDVPWCKEFIEQWFELYPEVRRYIEQQHYRARRYGVVWTLCGRVRRVPEVRSVHGRVVAAGLRQAGNMPVQGTQADLNKIAVAEVYEEVVLAARREGVEVRALMSIHDELLLEVERGYEELVRDLTADVMGRVMVDRGTGVNMCAVDIVAEGKVMERWAK